MMSTSRFIKSLAICHSRCMFAAVSCNSVPSMAPIVTKNLTTSSALKSSHQIQETPDANNSKILDGVKCEPSLTEFYKRKLPECCISFSSTEGKTIFTEALLSGHMDSFFPLAAQFRTQEEPAYCGLSTLVMVLNTLEVDPKKVWKGPWRWYHEDMLDCCIPLDIIERKGITMDQFACLAACNMLQVKMVHVDEDASEDHFRELVKSVTRKTDKEFVDEVLVTSYSRITLEQTGDGHFSPIGGYNPDKDLVLIMDTARFKYPPHWVALSQLFKAMQVEDPTTKLPRGYFLLTKNRFNPGLLFRLSSFFTPLGRDVQMVSFFNAWEELLATVLTGDMIGSDVAEMTLVEVLRLLSEIKDDIRLLTLQLDSKFAEELSYQCYSKNVIQMVDSLESLPFYSIITKRNSQISHEAALHAGLSPNILSSSEGNDSLRSTLESLTSSHFLAVFMLSWPYHRCRPGTLGSSLHKYFSSQLNRPGTELLQNECGRIRQQLSSIIGYAKKCSKICCK